MWPHSVLSLSLPSKSLPQPCTPLSCPSFFRALHVPDQSRTRVWLVHRARGPMGVEGWFSTEHAVTQGTGPPLGQTRSK